MSNNFTQEERRPNLHSVLISTLKNVWKKYEKSDLDQQLSVLATELRKKLYVIWKRRVYVRVRGRERLNVLKHNEARQRFCAEIYKIYTNKLTTLYRSKSRPFLSLEVFAVIDSQFGQGSEKNKAMNSFREILECHALACVASSADKKMDHSVKQMFARRAIKFLKEATRVTVHVQAELSILCNFLLNSQIEFGQEAVTLLVLPLYNALRKSQNRTSCLTSLHRILLQACLIAKTYNVALRILATPVVEVQPKITNFTIKDYVLFHYYSSRVYIAAKQYKNAKRSLLECNCFSLCFSLSIHPSIHLHIHIHL